MKPRIFNLDYRVGGTAVYVDRESSGATWTRCYRNVSPASLQRVIRARRRLTTMS